MKTIIRKYSSRMLLAFAGTFSLGMVSCDDMLDMKPQGQFTSDQLDDSSIEGEMAAAYAG